MSHKPRSPGGETDLRIGVSKAEHILLDLVDRLRQMGGPQPCLGEIAEQWLGHEPGKVTPERALELAARVVLAVEQMEDGL